MYHVGLQGRNGLFGICEVEMTPGCESEVAEVDFEGIASVGQRLGSDCRTRRVLVAPLFIRENIHRTESIVASLLLWQIAQHLLHRDYPTQSKRF